MENSTPSEKKGKNMKRKKKKLKNRIRELRTILGRTQGEFAVMIGASKDAVVSWELGRNALSESFARRIAFATGVEAESLLRSKGPLTCRGYAGHRVPLTKDTYTDRLKRRVGRSDEEIAREHARNCQDALELLLVAGAKAGNIRTRNRLPALVESFAQWCERTREDFQLDKAIEEQLSKQEGKLRLTHPYREWRRMQREDPAVCRVMKFRDDPAKADGESLTLETVVVPIWRPGYPMRGK
jgi:transcriptional regulator with XRE-family HTH domain